MTSETTSLAPAISARSEWARFFGFLQRPHVSPRATGITLQGVRATLRLLGLDLLIMLGLVLIAGAVVSLGFELPENELAGMELNLPLIAAIVIAAPLTEEIAFRGWLSGRPGHILATLILVAAVAIVSFTDITRSNAEVNVKAIATVVGAFIVSALSLFLLRKRGPLGWFAGAFPVFFWISTLAFALIHLLNYSEGTWMVLLPLVIPQLVVGSILGYLRVRYGLWSSILLHALHNAAAVGTVLLALEFSA